MTIERPGFSRRKLLSTAAVGVPAMGALSAVNLFGAPAAKANPYVPIDGLWGSGTTAGLQEVLGTPTDGVVSSQAVSWQAKNPGLTSGWDWVSDSLATGSTVIKALQQRLGVDADGLIGTNTIMALQGHCGTPQDGYFSDGSTCIMELQKKLNNGAL